MKKLLTVFATALLCVCVALSVTACGNDANNSGDTINVYAPDGAPALAIAQLMHEDNQFDASVSYHVVTSDAITKQVTGSTPAADVCILPVTAASKLLGNGTTYKMLGTVTHGNLYILSVNGEEVTAQNAQEKLYGKTVGIVNKASFPGQMFKLAMSKLNLVTVDADATEPTPDVSADACVTIKGVNATEVGGATNTCDYYVVPEQAASARIKATSQTPNAVTIKGNLQSLYGTSGYPQAVLVAKTSLIESNPQFIANFKTAMTSAASWLTQDATTIEQITTAISSHLPEGTAATLNTQNLTKEVITRCSVSFVTSANCKEEVKTFLSEMSTFVSGAAVEVTDNFFYI